jgi:hypothetical protein
VYQVFAAAAFTTWSKVPPVVPSALTSMVALPAAFTFFHTTKRVTPETVTLGRSSVSHQPEAPRFPTGPAASVVLIPVVELNVLADVPAQFVPP